MAASSDLLLRVAGSRLPLGRKLDLQRQKEGDIRAPYLMLVAYGAIKEEGGGQEGAEKRSGQE
jgi:hypothetical protein